MNSQTNAKTYVRVCSNANVAWSVSVCNYPRCIRTEDQVTVSWTCGIAFEEMQLVTYQSNWKMKRNRTN